jgi:hypothetical protein
VRRRGGLSNFLLSRPGRATCFFGHPIFPASRQLFQTFLSPASINGAGPLNQPFKKYLFFMLAKDDRH